MGIPKYELNPRPVDQEYDPNSTNAVSAAALAALLNSIIAPNYDPGAAYYPGDLVMRDGKIYRALVVIPEPGEAWTAAHWEEVNLNDFLQIDFPHLYQEIEYADLVQLRSQDGLVPGRWYRIVDYRTMSSTTGTYCAGHPFDVLVRADSKNVLNENAFAMHHDSDTYFQNSNLEAWQLKYCLDNDTTRFAWADVSEGKGVVYWMRDEWGNEAWYDFKNIMFERYKINACLDSPDLVGLYGTMGISGITVNDKLPVWAYTFCMIDTTNDETHDVSVDQDANCIVHDNVLKRCFVSIEDQEQNQKEVLALPNNVFITDDTITGGTFHGFYNNTVGIRCENNTFGGNGFYNNVFAGNDCSNNVFGNFCRNITLFGGVQYCIVSGGASNSSYTQNAIILGGTAGDANASLAITFTANAAYTQYAGNNTAGNLRIWNPADLIA